MIERLDTATSSYKQAEERFHPPAIFEHDISHSNIIKQQSSLSSSKPSLSSLNTVSSESDYSQPLFSGSYDYKPPDFIDAKQIPKPTSINNYSRSKFTSKGSSPHGLPLDSDRQLPEYNDHSWSEYYKHGHLPGLSPMHDKFHQTNSELFQDGEVSNIGSFSTYGMEIPPSKPINYVGYIDHSVYEDDHSMLHDHPSEHGYQDDILYDHLAVDHDHLTAMPEMNDQRLNKKPYSYYFIGKKLWYIPLYFSIYFIIYIAALVLKSIARHKINFPVNLAAAAASSKRSAKNYNIYDESSNYIITARVLERLENATRKFNNTS